jgi:hydroxymethylglutaryl-CoA lyase
MELPHHVTLVEVGPRDGLQNEATFLPTDTKISFIDQLSETGLSVIEATSFVSSKSIPQLADHETVLKTIKKFPHVQYPVLVPNEQGMKAALAAGARTVSVFTAASDTFCQRNIHCTIEESLERFEPVFSLGKEFGIPIRGYISCVLGCPYEGDISPQKVAHIANLLYEKGCYEISLGDTIGVGTPGKAQALIREVKQQIPLSNIAIHFHDTYGQALANIFACLQEGIQTIDSSISGLGGCPYAQGASGNVATEDVIYLLEGLGIHTGIDLEKILSVGQWICKMLHRETLSKVAKARLK